MLPLAASRPRPLALIIDNDPDTREMYAIHLEQSGLGVVEASDAAHALAMAHTFQPDVITTDLGLRDVGGGTILCERLQKFDDTKHIPVIAVTGSAMPYQVTEALAAGCCSVLLKPCLPDTLLSEIKRVLSLP